MAELTNPGGVLMGNTVNGSNRPWLQLRRWSHRWVAPAIAALAVLGLVAAACSAGDDDTAARSGGDASSGLGGGDDGGTASDDGAAEGVEEAAEEPAEEAAEEPAEAPADAAAEGEGDADESGAGGDAGSSQTEPTLDPAALGRSIVYVASVEVTVDDVALAASQAKTAIAGLGGLLFGEETSTGDRDRTVLEFKVFPDDFQDALARLEGLGELESQQITADDVTERVVDLRSRISTAEVSVDRLRDLLDAATNLEDVAALEAQLLQRETDLETLRGQLRTLEDQVDLATIFLTLQETAPPEQLASAEFEVTFYAGADSGDRCPGLDDVELDEGTEATVCVQLTNVGTVALAELEIRDVGLDLRPRDFTFVDADPERPLAPGETVTAWAELTVPGHGFSEVFPSAVAVDDEGERLRLGVEFVPTTEYSARFIEDDSLPGFVDALKGSWGTLKTIVGVLIIVAGALVPFLWVLAALWALRWWWLRRQVGIDGELDRMEAERNAAAQSSREPSDLGSG